MDPVWEEHAKWLRPFLSEPKTWDQLVKWLKGQELWRTPGTALDLVRNTLAWMSLNGQAKCSLSPVKWSLVEPPKTEEESESEELPIHCKACGGFLFGEGDRFRCVQCGRRHT